MGIYLWGRTSWGNFLFSLCKMHQFNSFTPLFCYAIFIDWLLHINTLWGYTPGRKKACLSCKDVTGTRTIGYDWAMKAGNKLSVKILTIWELRFCSSFAIDDGEWAKKQTYLKTQTDCKVWQTEELSFRRRHEFRWWMKWGFSTVVVYNIKYNMSWKGPGLFWV